MQLSFILVLCALFALAFAQANCGLSGAYTCSGGNIRGLEFGDDEDDDFFKYYLSDGNSQCSLFQEGAYAASASSSEISATFEIDDDECVIVGDNQTNCNCVTSLTMTASDGCDTLTLASGETCTSNEDCSDSFTCPGGQAPRPRPGYTPDANGCGPSALPLAGPSFGFLSCCEQHDFCYGTCGTDRAQCDNEFYSCMYCICQDSDNFIEEAFCEELACTYFQAVDEFGCPSFRGGQEDSCVCNSKDAVHEPTAMKNAPSKFGPGVGVSKQTELFCDAPFTPDTCPSATRTPTRTPSNTPNTVISRGIVTGTPTRSPAGNSGSSASRTPSNTPNTVISRGIPAPNPFSSISSNTSNDDDDDDITSRSPVTVTNTSNDDDDDESSLSSVTASNTSNDDDDDDDATLSAPSLSINNGDDDDDSSATVLMVSFVFALVALLAL